MVELFVLALENPLRCVVAVLCVVSLSLATGLFQIKQAVAVIHEQQEFDSYINEKVLNMSDALIRIDENVKFMKENYPAFQKADD